MESFKLRLPLFSGKTVPLTIEYESDLKIQMGQFPKSVYGSHALDIA
jgi:hypothetical protein